MKPGSVSVRSWELPLPRGAVAISDLCQCNDLLPNPWPAAVTTTLPSLCFMRTRLCNKMWFQQGCLSQFPSPRKLIDTSSSLSRRAQGQVSLVVRNGLLLESRCGTMPATTAHPRCSFCDLLPTAIPNKTSHQLEAKAHTFGPLAPPGVWLACLWMPCGEVERTSEELFHFPGPGT